MAAQVGKGLIVIGLLLAVAGAAIWAIGSVPAIGRLPGDIYLRRGNLTIYFPIATAILISVVLSLLMALLRR